MAAWLFFLTGAFPLWTAWQGNRRTSLFQAMTWTAAAWVAWGAMMIVVLEAGGVPDERTASYLALCLTVCAAVAVLGARRPGVGAWNFVLLGLLAVMLLPIAESLVTGRVGYDTPRLIFLTATLAVGVLNYLPTQLAPAALLCGLAGGVEVLALADLAEPDATFSWWLLALAPWVALACWRLRGRPASEFDLVWLDFRDRFGFFWAQRTREQFNRSAAHAGWPVILRWHGLRLKKGTTLPAPEVQSEIVATLRAMLQRFGPS
jgi:hypothetical protein